MSLSSTSKLRGLFLNQPKAQCSIFESGYMVYKALQLSDRYTLDYFDLEPATASLIPPADFYLFNYHHATMAWLDTKSLAALPGKKITVVLEMLPGNPFVYISPEPFDAYLVLDPTMNIDNSKVFGFPRPLEAPAELERHVEKPIPWIGTFGFSTPGKGFEQVVEAVNREFDRALVRINIPSGTFADGHAFRLHKQNYADWLTNLCKSVAKPGIEVQVTRDFMSKEELIRWCGENTLNCFLYCRNQPGLSATTDQCITAGRPLAVSANETFRHIHQYLRPYPERSLRDAIALSREEVLRMREDWTPRNFSLRFEEVLSKLGLMSRDGATKNWFLPPPPAKKKLLWATPVSASPGEKLFIDTAARVMNKSKLFTVTHAAYSNDEDLRRAVKSKAPDAVFHGFRMGANRVLPLNCNEQPIQDVPTFGVYCLAPPYDPCIEVFELIQSEYDEAVVLFYLPVADDPTSVHDAAQSISAHVRKSGVKPQFIHEAYEPEKLLALMGFPTLNVFPSLPADNLSLVDYALATQRPIAVMPGPLAEHFADIQPSVVAGERRLEEIISTGIAPLIPLYNDFSEARFILAFDEMASSLPLEAPKPALSQPLNRIIDEHTSKDYLKAIDKLRSLAVEVVDQTQPETLVINAFVLDTVEHFARANEAPRILAVDAHGSPAARTLERLGYSFESVDPRVNFDLEAFYALPTTAIGSYDIIFALSTLESIPDEEMFLAQIGDLLAPGGVAIVTCRLGSASGNGAGGLRMITEADFRERFMPLLQGCTWADEPRWTPTGSGGRPAYATLVIAKSESDR